MKFNKHILLKIFICVLTIGFSFCIFPSHNENFYFPKLNSTKFLSIESLNSEPDPSPVDYSQLFQYIGDKTFICIFLLYFQSTPISLFITSTTVKIIIAYFQIFINFDILYVIPVQIFQIFGITAYFLIAFTILYCLMFDEDKLVITENFKPKKKHDDSESINIIGNLKTINLRDVKGVVKIIGFILIAELIHQQMDMDFNYGSGNKEEVIEKVGNSKWTNFCMEGLASLIAVLAAIILGFIMSKQLNLKCNLMISSITFLILGIDMAIKFFNFERKNVSGN